MAGGYNSDSPAIHRGYYIERGVHNMYQLKIINKDSKEVEKVITFESVAQAKTHINFYNVKYYLLVEIVEKIIDCSL